VHHLVETVLYVLYHRSVCVVSPFPPFCSPFCCSEPNNFSVGHHLFSTLRCTSVMSIFRASSICKPRPSHTSSLAQLLCPVISWADVAYIPMPCNLLHFSWSTGLLKIKAVGFFQHIRNCSPNNAASHPTKFKYLS